MDHDTGHALIVEMRAIVRAGRAATAGFESAGTVPHSVITVLGLLDTGDGLRQGTLSRALGVDASVTSRHVAAATELGLVERRADPVDGRAFLLSITDEGRRVLAERRALRLAWLGEVMADWDDAEAQLLLEGLRRLREDVVEHSASAAARPLAAAAPAGP